MDVNIFLPPNALNQSVPKQVPVLFFLSGLTCSPNNCTEKGFFQKYAAEKGIAIVYPDTSPRGLNIPGEDDDWDFGSGAGFYINATKEPWNKNYKMEDYITFELFNQLFESFKELDATSVSITGHSMGGMGALKLFLQNPGKYRSVSAFSPISNPVNAPWGIKAFTGYFGEENKDEWKKNDATELVKTYDGPTPKILIDVGSDDPFYKNKQLLPENFVNAANESKYKGKVELRIHEGYDHSYFFISTFAEDHVAHAAKYLKE